MAVTNEKMIEKVVSRLTNLRATLEPEERFVLDEMIIGGPEVVAHAVTPDAQVTPRVILKDDKYRIFIP